MNFLVPTIPHTRKPILPDEMSTFNIHSAPNLNSMNNMDDFADRDAMFIVVSSLIKENQNLKKGNSFLKDKLQEQSFNSMQQEIQACSCTRKRFNKQHSAEKEPSYLKKNLKRCKCS